jgi:hypothetical protein
MDHAEGPTEEIAKIVCQVTINPMNHRRMGEVPIDPERDFPHEKISQSVHSIEID